ncbi:MAG: curved DNA-binding protein [Bacteroidetes bacterium]|nr:MAG: curved DNA-binding protein [Bacteroidota bacterium]
MKNYYSILGVDELAGDEEIKRAYRSLAKRWHPDKNHGNPVAEERFKEIAEAYAVLSDPMLRRQHDLKLQRKRVYSADFVFYDSPKNDQKENRRRGKPEYSEGFLRWRSVKLRADQRRRRVILVGMIIAFIAWIAGAQWLEKYNEEQSRLSSLEIERRLREIAQERLRMEKKEIDNLDSPFYAVFGDGDYDWLTTNHIEVNVPHADAVICLQQADEPYMTIRNEFIFAGNSFTLTNIPYGRYFIKVYEGAGWNSKRKLAGGKVNGAFDRQARFYRVDRKPFVFIEPTEENPYPNTVDSLDLNPKTMKIVPMTEAEFFKYPKVE